MTRGMNLNKLTVRLILTVGKFKFGLTRAPSRFSHSEVVFDSSDVSGGSKEIRNIRSREASVIKQSESKFQILPASIKQRSD